MSPLPDPATKPEATKPEATKPEATEPEATEPELPPLTLQTWTALIALAAGAFLFVTTEALPVGMLPQFAAGLGVSESTAGLLVTGYAFCVAATAVPFTAALAGANRRILLAGLLLTLALGAAAGAVAPNYAVLLCSRVVVASAQGVFWAMSAALAVAVVGPQRAGRGIAVVFGGISLAQVAGVPLITFVGAATSWRAALGVLAGLGALCAVAVAVSVPDLPGRPAGEEGSARTPLRPVLANRALLGSVTVIGVSFAAIYVTLTYFGPTVVDLAGVDLTWVSAFLLVFGVAGVGGNALAGAFVDRWPAATLRGALLGVVVAAVLLATTGHQVAAAVAAVGLWGLAGSALPTVFQTWALSLAPGHAEGAGSLVVVAVNLGIGLGAFAGGRLIVAGPTVVVWTTAGVLGVVLAALGLISLLAAFPALRPTGPARRPA